MMTFNAILAALVAVVAGLGRSVVTVASGYKAEILAVILTAYLMATGTPGQRLATVLLCAVCGFAGVKLGSGGSPLHA